MAIRWGNAKTNHHQTFGQARGAGTSFQMTSVALGADFQDRLSAHPHHSLQSSNLDRISKCSPCAMALGTSHGVDVDACKSHGLLDCCCLGGTVGSRDARTTSILVGGSANDCSLPILYHLLCAISLQKDTSTSFASLITIRRAIECETAPDMRKHASSAISYVRGRPKQRIHTHDQGHVTVHLLVLEVHHERVRSIHGHQRSRTSCVVS
mmetsp:Transcript_109628/g.210838  ORF Transcript_109628/g.210838 Transcript_109628/m.210838 type:complete len:210 (+) Transcript_109628:1327-1956(+)